MLSAFLVLAVLSSLAFGVLLAYGLCIVLFNVFRVHSISVAQQRIAAREALALSVQPVAQ